MSSSEAEPTNEDELASAFSTLYQELCKLARQRMVDEPTKTFSPTDLVHEVYLRLTDHREADHEKWKDRGYFFGAASVAMRRILIERARAKKTLKRGGNLSRTELSLTRICAPEEALDITMLDEALTELEAVYPEEAKLIQLKYFIGLDWEEIAEITGESTRTVRRKWAFARAWLRDRM